MMAFMGVRSSWRMLDGKGGLCLAGLHGPAPAHRAVLADDTVLHVVHVAVAGVDLGHDGVGDRGAVRRVEHSLEGAAGQPAMTGSCSIDGAAAMAHLLHPLKGCVGVLEDVALRLLSIGEGHAHAQ